MFIGAFLALEEMVLSWHLITLVPICLPLTEYGESRLDAELHAISLSQSITRADITYVVIVVETRNVIWESCSETIDSILPVTWVYVWHVIDS